MQRQRGLDEARDPRGGVQMADIGLDRPDPAEPGLVGGFLKGLGQRGHFDRVAQIGAGAVAFDIVDRVGGGLGDHLRLGDGFGLTVDRGRQIARLGRAVVVDGRALEHGPDVIAIGQRVPEAAQHHHARARAKDRALRAVVEGVAMTVGRKDLAFLVDIAPVLRQLDGHATRQRRVAFPRQQRLRGVMGGHQRGRAGGLHVHARPLEIKDVAGAGGQEILVVAGVAQQEHPNVINKIRVRADVEIEIAAHAAAGKDADRAARILGAVAGVLHRLPGHFEKAAVLGVHDRRFLGREAKELGVEILEPRQRGGGAHVIGAVQPVRRLAGLQQLLGGVAADRFNPVAQVGPIGLDRVGAGQMRGHADNGDVGFGNRLLFGACTH